LLYFYPIIIASFFSGILFFLTQNVLLPTDEFGNLIIKDCIIFSVLIFIILMNVFAFFYMIFDKLFFKKFFERPSLIDAYRRGAVFGLFLLGLMWIRIFDLWFVHIIILLIITAILIEFLLNFVFKREEKEEKDENDRQV